jgi:hypothetical protein
MHPPKKIDITCGKLLPWHFRVLAIGIIGTGIVMGNYSTVIAALSILVGISMLTATEGTEIYPTNKTYREYNSFFFARSGKLLKYNTIERIFINSSRVKEIMHTAHTSQSSTFVNTEYRAYLKLDNGEKILLTKKRNKDSLLQQMKKVADELQT